MQPLSVDYEAVLAALHAPLDAASVGAALLAALGDRYDARQRTGSALHEFQQSGATYLFDLASSAHLPQKDRTVTAWALTPAVVLKRDTAYQRGFPMAPGADDHGSTAATSYRACPVGSSGPTSSVRTEP